MIRVAHGDAVVLGVVMIIIAIVQGSMWYRLGQKSKYLDLIELDNE